MVRQSGSVSPEPKIENNYMDHLHESLSFLFLCTCCFLKISFWIHKYLQWGRFWLSLIDFYSLFRSVYWGQTVQLTHIHTPHFPHTYTTTTTTSTTTPSLTCPALGSSHHSEKSSVHSVSPALGRISSCFPSFLYLFSIVLFSSLNFPLHPVQGDKALTPASLKSQWYVFLQLS